MSAAATETPVDIAAHGVRAGFLSVQGLTQEGRAWLTGNTTGEATWFGDALCVEHRYGPDLLLGAHNDGLTVALDGRIADAPRP